MKFKRTQHIHGTDTLKSMLSKLETNLQVLKDSGHVSFMVPTNWTPVAKEETSGRTAFGQIEVTERLLGLEVGTLAKLPFDDLLNIIQQANSIFNKQ